MKSSLSLLILLLMMGCVETNAMEENCSETCEFKELQMCGDGIVRERCVSEKGCGYLKAVCYSKSAILFAEQLLPGKSKEIIRGWKKDGLVSCDKLPSYKTHPYIP